MDIDSIISQLETDELSKDFSIHNKMKKKIKLTSLPKQINVNRFPINSPSLSTSSTSSSSTSPTSKLSTNLPTQSSSHPLHHITSTSPIMPPYPIKNPPQDPETITDLDYQTNHPIDIELIKLYGDTVHRNLGTHLTGNINNDPQWYYIWYQLISYHHPLYTPPQSKLGRDIVNKIADEFQGVRLRKWNSEKALLLPIIILQKSHQKLTSQEIKHRLRFRLDQWNQGHFIELATDTITEAYQYHESKSPNLEMDEKLQIFNQLVYHGKLQETLRFLTNKHTENTILQPDDVDPKTGKSVLEVLKSKHPSLRIQDITQDKYKLDKYNFVPQPLDLHITENDVKLMAPQLHGSGGPTSLDSSLLTDLLLRYGISSTALRTEMANWSEWLANESPPWAAYRATMATRAVAFNKFPYVRPLSIGELYRRLWARLIISQTRDQAKAACNTTELCAGLETGIDAAIHAVRACTLSRSSFQTPIDTYHNSSSSQSTSPTQPSPSSNHSTPSDPNPSSSTKSPTSPSCPPQSTSPPSTTPPSIPPDSPSNPSTSLPIKPPSKAPPDTTHSPTSQSHTASSTIPTRTTQYNLRPRTPKPNDSSSLPPTSTKQSSLTSHPPQSTQPNITQSPTSPIIPPPSYPPNSPTSSPSPPPTSSPSSNPDLHTPPPPSTQPTKPPTTRLDPSPHNPTPNTPTIPNPKSPSPPHSSPSLSTPSTSPHQTSTAPSSPTTPLDVTLLDASNGFNEISRLRCLHTIRHLWPSASRFAFNCYRHSIQVCIRQHNSPATIIPGCEGIQQGDPLSMILYGLALTPMIDRIHTNNSSIFLSENFLDPWYADDATIVATVFDTITIVQAIQNLGPIYGYFIQPEKSIHICSKLQIPKSKPLFQAVNLNFQYVEGT